MELNVKAYKEKLEADLQRELENIKEEDKASFTVGFYKAKLEDLLFKFDLMQIDRDYWQQQANDFINEFL